MVQRQIGRGLISDRPIYEKNPITNKFEWNII